MLDAELGRELRHVRRNHGGVRVRAFTYQGVEEVWHMVKVATPRDRVFPIHLPSQAVWDCGNAMEHTMDELWHLWGGARWPPLV